MGEPTIHAHLEVGQAKRLLDTLAAIGEESSQVRTTGRGSFAAWSSMHRFNHLSVVRPIQGCHARPA